MLLNPVRSEAMREVFSKVRLKNSINILKAAFSGFINNRTLTYSASLAYYSIFSMAPLLLLMIFLAGIFLGKDAAQGKVFAGISGLVGNEPARQVQDMIKHLETSGKSTISAVIGVITLLIGAASVFTEIQNSMNMIWKVKAKPQGGWIKMIRSRLLSSSLIIILGFLLMVSLIINGALLALGDMLRSFLPALTVALFNFLDIVISFGVTFLLFGVIFKVLPDIKLSWKDVRAGAAFTAILFMIGSLMISLYIKKTAAGSTYGAAGALIVILLWIYYSAAILYFGAEFTKAYADSNGTRIIPAAYAIRVEETETESGTDVASIGDNDKGNNGR
jgi:membrane protein